MKLLNIPVRLDATLAAPGEIWLEAPDGEATLVGTFPDAPPSNQVEERDMTQTANASTIDIADSPDAVVRAAQAQWFSRPADQKYPDLDTLIAALDNRRNRTLEVKINSGALLATQVDGDLRLTLPGVPAVPATGLVPTHYAFGQAATLLGYSAKELRKLHDRQDLVVDILNHFAAKRGDDVKLMVVEPDVADDLSNLSDSSEAWAFTGPDYGRIWDIDVALAAKTIVDRTEGRFYPALDWGREKRSLFASDRDIFLFFIDGGSIVDGGGERDQLNRGFYLWNSEVGTRTFGISTFLFRQVCGNFGIWGHEDVRVLKIRHTSGGPEKFVTEAIPALNEFVNAPVRPLEARIKAAKAISLPTGFEDVVKAYKPKGFSGAELKRAQTFALAEEGQFETLWDLVQGLTSASKYLAYADARLDLDTRAGRLMDAVSV